MANENTNEVAVASSATDVDLDAHARRIGAQDRVATGILTVIVVFVLGLLAAIVAFILIQGLGKALTPGDRKSVV